MFRRMNTINRFAAAALGAAIVLGAPAFNAAANWFNDTATASAGTINPGDEGKLQFKGARAIYRRDANPGKAIIRYNINPFNNTNLTQTLDSLWLGVGFRVNDGGHLKVRLRRYDIMNGAHETLAVWDSDAFPSTGDHDFEWYSDLAPAFTWNPVNYIYFLEVTMTKTASNGIVEFRGAGVWPNAVP